MDLDPVLLSRIQFAFTISFHIIFPSFTIGLAAWLATSTACTWQPAIPAYRRVFDFWLKVFAVSFGMGVVSGIVMAFEFGTNWSVLARENWLDPGAAARLRNLHGVSARGDVPRRGPVRSRARPALVLLSRMLHDRSRYHGLVVLDHGQQQLDAGAGRTHDRRR